MKAGRATLSLLIVLVLLFVFVYKRWQEPSRKEPFDRTPDKLSFTRHARCRMDCRRISQSDIDDILRKGIINYSKSDRNDRPCPTFALQGETSDGDKIRVIFAQCDAETKVITCYHLNQEFECNCPGDEKKR